MKVEVNLTKKQVFISLAIILIVGGIFVVYASAPNPGHEANDIGFGTFSNQGCPGNNPANCVWVFPGKVGIGTSNPLQTLHLRADDAIIFQGTSKSASRAPAISFREDAVQNGNGDPQAQHWEIIKRGSQYAPQPDNFLLSYFDGQNWKDIFRLTPTGDVYMITVSGTGHYLCIDDNGKLYRSTSACA